MNKRTEKLLCDKEDKEYNYDDDTNTDDFGIDVSKITENLKKVSDKLKNNARWNSFKYISSMTIFMALSLASFVFMLYYLCNPGSLITPVKVLLSSAVFEGSMIMYGKIISNIPSSVNKKSKEEKRIMKEEKKKLRKQKKELRKVLNKEKNDRPDISIEDLEIKDKNVGNNCQKSTDASDKDDTDLNELGKKIVKNTEEAIFKQENSAQVSSKSVDNSTDGPNISLDELEKDTVYQKPNTQNANTQSTDSEVTNTNSADDLNKNVDGNMVNNVSDENILKLKLFKGFKKAIIEESNVNFVEGIGVYIYPIMKTDKDDITFFEAGYKAVYGEAPTSVETDKHRVYMLKRL